MGGAGQGVSGWDRWGIMSCGGQSTARLEEGTENKNRKVKHSGKKKKGMKQDRN